MTKLVGGDGRTHIQSRLMRESLQDRNVLARTDSERDLQIFPDVSLVSIGGQSIFDRGKDAILPLVAELAEVKKRHKIVIGVGVKNSSSDLLISNCDEFIYYDDLVRAEEQKRRAAKKRRDAAPAGDDKKDKKQEAFDLLIGTLEALIAERGADEKIWGSMVKQALKRRQPGFNESYHGFGGFNELLEEAQARGLVKLEHDEKSGGYIVSLPR